MSLLKREGRRDPKTGKRKVTWYAEIRSNGRHHREAVGPRKEDAQAVLAKWKEEIRLGRFPELKRVKPVLFKWETLKEVGPHEL